MKLGILADSHGQVIRTELAVRLLRDAGAEALVHCGDLADTAIVGTIAVLPSWFVFGNHDSDLVRDLQKTATENNVTCLGWGGAFNLDNRRIGVCHGHLTTDLRKVLAEKPEILLTGHSHEPFDFMDGALRRVNPGALFRAKEFSVALLDLRSDELKLLIVER